MEESINQREAMSNKVDKLFKDKLEGHSLQPSAQAWDKVEAHLGKKNKMVLWVRVAAAIALLGLLVFAALNWTGSYEKTQHELVKEDDKTPKNDPVEEIKQPIAKEEVKSQKKEVRSQKPVVRSQENVDTQRETRNPEPGTSVPESKAEEPVAQIAVVEEPKKGITLSYTLPKKGITLTYSLPSVKKPEEALDEPLVAKKTGFERVLEIANEVKNGDPLAELREAKNDILALEFRKDKDKNKKQN